ncbi:MAG: IS3 family transposase, partial [Actinomycetota bacterium]
QIFTSNDKRSAALPDFLHYYNHQRRHHALSGHPPTSRLSPT